MIDIVQTVLRAVVPFSYLSVTKYSIPVLRYNWAFSAEGSIDHFDSFLLSFFPSFIISSRVIKRVCYCLSMTFLSFHFLFSFF